MQKLSVAVRRITGATSNRSRGDFYEPYYIAKGFIDADGVAYGPEPPAADTDPAP